MAVIQTLAALLPAGRTATSTSPMPEPAEVAGSAAVPDTVALVPLTLVPEAGLVVVAAGRVLSTSTDALAGVVWTLPLWSIARAVIVWVPSVRGAARGDAHVALVPVRGMIGWAEPLMNTCTSLSPEPMSLAVPVIA